ncbi:MAG: SDR family oxidoreductase [Deltaproteobacteria bacterium]|nr:SDR family oxidoreductase [Deltaproteobacteria bacterium]
MEPMNNYLNQLFNLEGKIAVVIGAGGFLCSEMARGFAHAGCAVAVLDLRIKKARAVEAELRETGYSKVISCEIDVTKKQNHVNALDFILKRFGRVDILINGAGINAPTPFFDISLEEWYAVLDSQITGTFLGCQVFGQHMLENGSGSVINISSASAGPPLSKAYTYSVAKAGIKNLTQNLAREWGKKGVRVNALRPGFFPTAWNRIHFITEERERAILGHTPMARYGEPSELVGAVLWLASDSASFVTGAEICVDGGFSCMSI